jgi:tetratricopeptide (TPR) repeat protein
MDLLNKDCDPEAFGKIYKEIFERRSKKNKPCPNWCYINLSTALIESGAYDEAAGILAYIKYFESNKKGNVECLIYNSNLISIFLHRNEIDRALEILNKSKKIIDVLRIKEKERVQWNSLYKRWTYLTHIHQGNFLNAESVFSSEFENAKTNFARVNAMFTLGIIFMHFNDFKKAKIEFEYVVQHGNKLFIATKARELLNNMEHTVS